MKLGTPSNARATISLVPLVDVMLILLIFFMVTSTYLNLDMVPVVERADDVSDDRNPGDTAGGSTVLLRLSANGDVRFRGKAYQGEDLVTLIRERISDNPAASFVVLPSGGASMQMLVKLMEEASQAGAANLRVLRLEGRP